MLASITTLEPSNLGRFMCTEKAIHGEEVSNVDIAESMAELNVRLVGFWSIVPIAEFSHLTPERARGVVCCES